MKCKRAKSRIALVVGNDLDTASKKELDAHLSACPPCRDYWRDMKSSMQVLHDPAVSTEVPSRGSVWPRVASRLPRRAPRQSHAPFKGWAAAASVALACSVLVAYGVTYQSPNATQPFAVPSQMMGLPSGTDGNALPIRREFDRDVFKDEKDRSKEDLSAESRMLRDLEWHLRHKR